jgi:hypothetical protein
MNRLQWLLRFGGIHIEAEMERARMSDDDADELDKAAVAKRAVARHEYAKARAIGDTRAMGRWLLESLAPDDPTRPLAKAARDFAEGRASYNDVIQTIKAFQRSLDQMLGRCDPRPPPFSELREIGRDEMQKRRSNPDQPPLKAVPRPATADEKPTPSDRQPFVGEPRNEPER